MVINRWNTLGWILGATLFASCSAATVDKEKKKDQTLSTASNETATTIVQTAVAKLDQFQYVIHSNGKIKSLHEQLISCESGGKLLLCKAQTGKLFSAGSTIVQLETTSLQYRLQKAKLTQFNSQKEYESQLLGYENLLKDKTKEESDDIRQKLKISTGLAGAEQEIKETNYELAKAVIKAPFTGVLADVKVQQGQQLKPGQELFRIYDPFNLLLEVKTLEADISLLKIGTPAEVSPISTPEISYKASVYEINPYVDETGMVMVRLEVSHSTSLRMSQKSGTGNKRSVAGQSNLREAVGLLFPGINCTATIKAPFAKTLVVPKEAVVMRSGKSVVFILEDGKAKWNYVTTGRDNGKEVEIIEGLKPGMKVINSNNLQLAHDAPVQEAKDSLQNNQ